MLAGNWKIRNLKTKNWCFVQSHPALCSLLPAGRTWPAVAEAWSPCCRSGSGGLSAEAAHQHGRPDAESGSAVKPCCLLQGDFISGTA